MQMATVTISSLIRNKEIRYSDEVYWDDRYIRMPEHFDWFVTHEELRRAIRASFVKNRPTLHIGCGTSTLQEGLARSGYTVVNTDVSPVVISLMRERHKDLSKLTYTLADARHMPAFHDCQFGNVLDKGTLDALLCCTSASQQNARQMLREVSRVLQPARVFLLVSIGRPSLRLPLLLDPHLEWDVSIWLLPLQKAALRNGVMSNSNSTDTLHLGPFKVLNDQTIGARALVQRHTTLSTVGYPDILNPRDFIYIYQCKKAPLQLPDGPGQIFQLPAGCVQAWKQQIPKLQKELGLSELVLTWTNQKREKPLLSRFVADSRQLACTSHNTTASIDVTGGPSCSSRAELHTSGSLAVPRLVEGGKPSEGQAEELLHEVMPQSLITSSPSDRTLLPAWHSQQLVAQKHQHEASAQVPAAQEASRGSIPKVHSSPDLNLSVCSSSAGPVYNELPAASHAEPSSGPAMVAVPTDTPQQVPSPLLSTAVAPETAATAAPFPTSLPMDGLVAGAAGIGAPLLALSKQHSSSQLPAVASEPSAEARTAQLLATTEEPQMPVATPTAAGDCPVLPLMSEAGGSHTIKLFAVPGARQNDVLTASLPDPALQTAPWHSKHYAAAAAPAGESLSFGPAGLSLAPSSMVWARPARRRSSMEAVMSGSRLYPELMPAHHLRPNDAQQYQQPRDHSFNGLLLHDDAEIQAYGSAAMAAAAAARADWSC